ncbi:unnamed protein product [Calypogeia fissa]
MAFRLYVLLERIGQRQRVLPPPVKNYQNNIARRVCPPTVTNLRQFCTDFDQIFPKNTKHPDSTQVGDRHAYLLTQLFAKLLKSGEEKQAAEVLDGIAILQKPAKVAICNSLLNSCSKSRNPEMAKLVWSFMKSNGVQTNEVSFGCMLGALSRGGCLEEAVDLLHMLFKRRQANVVMYNTVLNGCMHAKSKRHAARCVQLMEAQGVAKDELSYAELIKLSGMRGDLNCTKKWWKRLNQNFAPNPSTRSPYIIALSRMNALTEAYQEIRNMVSDLGLQIGPEPLDDKEQILDQSYVGLLCEAGREDDVGIESKHSVLPETNAMSSKLQLPKEPALTESGVHVTQNQEKLRDEDPTLPKEVSVKDPAFSAELPSLGPRLPKNTSTSLKNLQNAYNSLINAAGKAGDHKLAESLFAEMRQLGLKTDIYTYNALLRAVVEGRGVPHALRIVRKMEASGPQPDVYSLTALLDGYCQQQDLNEAEDILQYMERGGRNQRPNCCSYNILLKACAAVDDPVRALRVFARMKEAGVAPDNCTYLALFSACAHANAGLEASDRWSRQEVAKKITAIEMDMAQSGVPHSRESLTTVMRVFGAEGLTEAMLQRLQDAKDGGKSLLDTASFNTVIGSCLNAKQVETGWDVYRQMKVSGVKPDVYTYNILINGCALDKNISTAFELVETMQQEGLGPDVVTFNSLLKVVCYSGEMPVVLDLLKEMSASGVHPDAATFNTILTSASYHKRLDVTEHVLEEMQRRKVAPDQYTLLPVVSIYMQAGKTDDAVEALRVLSLRILDGSGTGGQSELNDLNASQLQDALEDLAKQNLHMQEDTRALLTDAVFQKLPESLAIYAASLAGLVHGDNEAFDHNQSSWANRLSTQYDRRKTVQFAKFLKA